MTAYVPQPGTIPARAVDYLRTLAAGIEVPTAVLGEALDQPSSTIYVCLEAAVNSGLVRKRRKDGERFMLWSIGDGVPISRARPVDDEPDDHPIEQRIVPAATAAADDPMPGVNIDTAHAKPARKKPGRKPGAKTARSYTALPPDSKAYIAAIEKTVPADRAPSREISAIVQVAAPADFRCGIFTDGELHLEKGGERIVLERFEFEKLVSFLERMAVAQ